MCGMRHRPSPGRWREILCPPERAMARSFAAIVVLAAVTVANASALDFTRAVVVTPGKLRGPQEKAIAMLIEEAEKRTQIRWPRAASWPKEADAVIVVGSAESLKDEPILQTAPAISSGAEGYRIWTHAEKGRTAV